MAHISKKSYKKIIDEISTAIIVVDKNGRTLFINDAFRKLFPDATTKCGVGRSICCAHCANSCESCARRQSCSVYTMFRNANFSHGVTAKRVVLDIRIAGEEREVSFPLCVKPMDNGLCLGTIDTSAEYLARIQMAADIQQRFLPTHTFVGSKLYSYIYKPLNEVSGDIVEPFTVSGKACAMIADVSGKDVSAGMLTQFVKGAYNTGEYSPAKAIEELRERFCELSADEKNYITVAAVRVDDESITYSMAGHNAPILLKSKEGITRISSNSPPVCNWFENPTYYEDFIPYSSGDILVMLTDGVTECRNPGGETFGTENVVRVLSVSVSAQDFISRLDKALCAFCDEPKDDITAIAFDM